MKAKQILPAIVSFCISLFYLAAVGNIIAAILKAPQRNFAVLWLLPYAASAVLYYLIGFLMRRKKLTRERIKTLFIAILCVGIAPVLLFSMLLSPIIFTTLDFGTNVLLFVPIIISVFPFILYITKRGGKP